MSGSIRVAARTGLAVLMVFMAAEQVRAVDMGYSLGLTGESSDNISQEPENSTRSEWITRYQAALFLDADERAFTSHTTLSATYQDFKRNIFEDRVDYLLNSALSWNILPQRLIFNVEELFTRIQINPTGTDTPDNQQNTNVLSLGPTINARMGEVDSLVLEGRYTDSYYEDTDTDNRGLFASSRFRHSLSPVLTTSINYSARVVKYDQPVYPTVITQRATLGYERIASRRTFFSAEVGRAVIDDRSKPADNTFHTIGTARWIRQTTRNSAISLEAGREVSDASQILLEEEIRQQQTGSNVIESGTVFLTSRVGVRFQRSAVSGNQEFRLLGREIEFENPGDLVLTDAISDQRLGSAYVAVSHNLTESSRAGFGGSYSKTEYLDTFRIDRDSTAEAWFQRLIRKRLGVRVTLSRRERSSTNLQEEYVENRAAISIGYNYREGQTERDLLNVDGLRVPDRRESGPGDEETDN